MMAPEDEDGFTPTFAVQYVPDDLQVRLFYVVEKNSPGEEECHLIKIFPSPQGPNDENARKQLTQFLLYFSYEA